LKQNEAKEFREQIRILERKLGLLNKNGGSSCSQVTLAQCHTLVEIGRVKNISLKHLALLLTLDMSTMSRTVDSLVKKNYVKRTASETDRRSVDIQLTNIGLELFNDIETKMNNNFARIFELMPQEARPNVMKSLDIIIEAFRLDSLKDNTTN